MNDELPLPQELQHLIEKRSSVDRRRKKRRSGDGRRQADLGPLGTQVVSQALATAADPLATPAAATPDERRHGKDRRTTARRNRPRRRGDAAPRE
jgi:hypothetical protein